MSSLRYRLAGGRLDRLAVQIGGPNASVRGQWPVLLVSLAAVFACFYALGRIVNTGSAARAAAPGALQAASVNAAIPHALSGGSPTAGAVPGAIEPTPAPARARSAASASGRPVTALTQPTATTVTETSAPTPEPQRPAGTPESVRTEASPPSRSSSGSASSGQRAAAKGTPSGGVSFDSSE